MSMKKHKKIIAKLLLLAFFGLVVLITTPKGALAEGALGGIGSSASNAGSAAGSSANSAAGTASGNITINGLAGTPSSVGDIVPKVTNTLLTFAGIISVIMIIVGGIMYSLSAGDSKKSATAKDTILYAVIGLVITLLAGAIVSFVLKIF